MRIRVLGCPLLCALLAAGCGGRSGADPDPATREKVWAAILPQAARYRIEPAFIFALVAAESNFDPRAQNGTARGLLQLKPAAWHEVGREPYEPAVWDWRKNLAVGVDYLAWCRSYLQRKQKFSDQLLLATFHYGVDYVEQRDFDTGRIAPPDNEVYRELWRGHLSPVPVPE